MTTETESEKTTENQQDQADAEAAFAAGFDGKELPAATAAAAAEPEKKDEKPAATPAPSPAPAASAAPATPTPTAAPATPQPTAAPAPAASTTEAAPTPAPSPRAADENAELKAELRKVHGRIGALNDELTKLRAAKEAEGKPAVATQIELAGLKEAYPEFAELLAGDLGKALAGLAGKASDPKELDELVNQRVEARAAQMAADLRDAAVTDAHPNWKRDLFTEDSSGKKAPTADYLAWRKSLKEDEARDFETSTNPYRVIRGLTAFYEWKAKAAQQAAQAQQEQAEKQKRLADAVTPQGTPRASPPTLSDDEAMRKGFEEGFNS